MWSACVPFASDGARHGLGAQDAKEFRGGHHIPPIVGSLFSWKSLFTNRRTKEDWKPVSVLNLTWGEAAWISLLLLGVT